MPLVSVLGLLIANRATRTFGYGFLAVVLGIYLDRLGTSPALVIAAFGVALASAAVLNILVGYYGDRFGRKKAMILFGLLMTVAGLILAVASNFPIALLGLAFGAVSPTGTEVSPFLSIEQSIVADAARQGRRTRAFAVYNLLGSLGAAAGGLAGGVPALLAGGTPAVDDLRPMFLLYALLGLVAAGISAALPGSVELREEQKRVPLSPTSRSRIVAIGSLFATDSFAGGFVLQGTILYWFSVTYPGSQGYLGLIFAIAGVLSAFSFLLAARLGERIGLLETMVYTHIPSNVLLILIPLAPGLPFAVAAYLGRQALSQMDVPTRQAYLAGIVSQEERTAANAYTNTARNATQAAGPFLASGLVTLLGQQLGITFFFGGGIKIAYDLAIYRAFRRIRPESL